MRFPNQSGQARGHATKRAPLQVRTLLARARVIPFVLGAAIAACVAPNAVAQSQAQGPAAAPLSAPAGTPAAAQTAAARVAQPLPPAQMPSTTPAGIHEGAQQALRYLVEREFGSSYRVEITVGQLDPRLQLSPCGRAEPFLPPAARLWGRTSIGVRCVEGASWSVLLPVTVSVYGNALVAATTLSAGASPTLADFRVQEIDLTRQHGTLVTDPEALSGKVLTRAIGAGQILKDDALRAPHVVSAGDPVRILVVGQGFTISSDGVALNAAAEGERVRVRTEAGKVLVGPIRNRAVELRL